MCDIDSKILNLLNENYSLKEISKFINLSSKEIYDRLRKISYGKHLSVKYFFDGNIKYNIDDCYSISNTPNEIIIPNNINNFRCLIISDTHVGNIHSSLDLIKKVYDYASKNYIHIIFHVGDLIEGTYSSDKKNISKLNSQVEYVIEKYPYDKDINSFILYGNHDYHSLYYDGFDISKFIEYYRYDLVSLGYGICYLKLKEDFIKLKHDLCLTKLQDKPDTPLVFVGHGHEMKTKIYESLNICIPSLSYVCPNKIGSNIPGFIDLNVDFKGSKMEYIKLKHLIVDSVIYECSEVKCKFNNNDKQKLYKIV